MKKAVLIFFILTSELLFATVRNVPGSYSTIAQGLSSSLPGDTILVAPGTYFENINWPNIQSLKLISSGGPTVTIIDGGGSGSVLRIVSGFSITFDSTTVVDGFQITNGYLNTTYADGGGIYIDEASPTLRNLEVHNNSVTSFSWAYGAGIHCGNDSYPIIEYCNIHDNSNSGGSWAYGGGIYIDFDAGATISNCNIYNNIINSPSRANGGGIYTSFNSVVTITNCNIYSNHLSSGIWASGGGILIGDGRATILNCNITDNTADGNRAEGGGIKFDYNSVFDIDSCVIENNALYGSGSHYGAGIECSESNGTISNSMINQNKQYGNFFFRGAGLSASNSTISINNTVFKLNQSIPDSTIASNIYGVGIFCENNSIITLNNGLVAANSLVARSIHSYEGCGIYGLGSTLRINHSTIAENEIIYDSTHFGSAINFSGGYFEMKNSISWNPRCLNEKVLAGGFAVSYSNVRSITTSNGNIDSDPMFIGGNDYHLLSNSPCINAGIINAALPYDLDGNPRPLPAGTNPDMGAYEMDQPVGLNNFETSNHSSVFPNPVIAESIISLHDLNDRIIQVEIYNGLGQLEISKSGISSNTYNLNSVDLKSGVYLYQLTTRSGEILKGKFVVN